LSDLLKINDIVYGAVHDTHDFRYSGFCKKVRSDDVQSVDVWIDGEKVETLTCDKRIEKISNIYDKKGFAFQYKLPDGCIGEKCKISFTCNGQELENSPMVTIAKDDSKYNEYRFMKSLGENDVEEKIKNLYCKDSIGFFATKENLADEEFIGYIKELYARFPEVTFKAFYFNNEQKEILKFIFKNEIDRLKLHIPKNILDVAKEIEIFTEKWTVSSSRKVFWFLFRKCKKIYTTGYLPSMFTEKIIENDHVRYASIIKNIDINYNIENSDNRGEFTFYDLIHFALKYEEFKFMIYEANRKYIWIKGLMNE